jgi:hypothetical protein
MSNRHENKQLRRRGERGNTIVEFALVMVFLVPMFAGSFTIGMGLAKAIQVSNVTRDAVVLMVRSNTDPQSGLDLSQNQNQRIIVRAAAGLGMNSDAQYDPNPNGNSVVYLSRVVKVGPNECALGVSPPPSGVPNATPPDYGWTTGNCPNYGSYAFSYRVVIGNGSRWSSTIGQPQTTAVRTDGTVSPVDVATNNAVQANSFTSATGMTLLPGVYALVSEMYADVSFLNFFSILSNPTLYARSIS